MVRIGGPAEVRGHHHRATARESLGNLRLPTDGLRGVERQRLFQGASNAGCDGVYAQRLAANGIEIGQGGHGFGTRHTGQDIVVDGGFAQTLMAHAPRPGHEQAEKVA